MEHDADDVGISPRRFVHDRHEEDWCHGFSHGHRHHHGQCQDETEVARAAMLEIARMVKSHPEDALLITTDIVAALEAA